MTARTVAADHLSSLSLTLGESPVWDDRSNTLLVVDIVGERILRLSPDGREQWRSDTGRMVGAVALAADGGILAAVQGGIARQVPDGGWSVVVPIEADRPDVRLNDGEVDRDGRWWIGSMAVDASPAQGALFCVGTDGRVTRVIDGVGVSNGIAWGPDGSMHYVDSHAGGVDILMIADDAGGPRLLSRRRFVDVPGEADVPGVPDGMTIDEDGAVYVAVNGGGEVRRWSRDGVHDLTVRVPTPQVTSLTFGGPDLGTLYVTTAREHMSPAEAAANPRAGDLFACRPGARGVPARRARLAA